MDENTATYKLTRTYIHILDTTGGHKELKNALSDLKDSFSLTELKTKAVELVLDTHGKKHETYYPILQNKITFYGTIKQLVTTEDNKHFSRELQIRVDDTHHNDYDLHINITLIDRYVEANKTRKQDLGEFHVKHIQPSSGGMFSVSMIMPGRTITLPVVCFIDGEDLEFHKKQQDFLRKLKKGKLSKEDELEFETAFDSYSKTIRRRKGLE